MLAKSNAGSRPEIKVTGMEYCGTETIKKPKPIEPCRASLARRNSQTTLGRLRNAIPVL